MSSAWIVYVLTAGTIIAAAVAAVDAACRLAGLPRRWAPFGGLLMIIALAIIAPETAPRSHASIDIAALGIPLSENSDVIAAAPAPATVPLANALQNIREGIQQLPHIAESLLPRRFESLYAAAWGVISAVLLLLYLLVHVRFMRARRGWPFVNLHGKTVRLSQSAGPAVVGVLHPDIVIPRWLLQREREQQLLVLEHEEEHVRARDPLLLVSAWTCALALPWHPAAWWMLWRLRLAVELDCDARVLSRGTPRGSYGSLLIELAQQSSGLPVGAAALSDRTSHLERRLLAMNINRPSFSALRSSAFALVAIILVLSACALRKSATPAESIDAIEEPVTFVAVAPPVTTPLAIVDGVIQMAPTAPPSPVPPVAPPVDVVRTPEPLLVIDGVIQPRTVDTTPLRAPPAQPVFTRPLIIIDGVIQMVDDPTVGAVRPRVDTLRPSVQPQVAPPAPRPVESALQIPQQLGRLLVVINGVITSDTSLVLRNLTGDQIESVEVLRGDGAAALYGERARNGVLSIRTRGTQSSALSPLGGRGGGPGGGRGAGQVAGLQVRGSSPNDVVIQVRNPLSMAGPTPLIILDGVIQMDSLGANLSNDAVSRLIPDPAKIQSIEIVRGAAAVSLYGQRAVNGVIVITTKR